MISSSGTSPGQSVTTNTASEPNHVALILVCGCVNLACDKRPINALLQKEYVNYISDSYFSAQTVATAIMSETSSPSSTTVISTSGTSPGQPPITDATSESNHLALILVRGCMN